MNNKLRRIVSMIMVVMMIITSVGVPVYGEPIGLVDHVIIHQVYGGGGNSGAVYTHDFVELYNPTDSPVDLSGWSVQYASATGTFSSGSNLLELSGAIPAHGYFLIQCVAGANTELPELPSPDLVGELGLAGKSGKVVLSSGVDPVSSKDDSSVIDFVGYGSANEYEGSGSTATLSNSTAAIRKALGVDTNDNKNDFTVGAPSPRVLEDAPKKVTITASDNRTDAISGASLQLTTNADEGIIYYTFEPVAATTSAIIAVKDVQYTSGSVVEIKIIGEIGEKVTLSAFAKAEGYETSDVFQREYTIKDPYKVYDLKEFLTLEKGTTGVTVEGTIAYFATAKSDVVLHSEIDGKIYVLFVYGAAPVGAKVGDVVRITGKADLYGGVPQLSGLVKSEIVGPGVKFDPLELTISEIIDRGVELTGRFVKVSDVVIGKVDGRNTAISDETGSINIFDASPFPVMVGEGDEIDLYAMIGRYNSTIQLRTGLEEDNGFNVYDIVNDTKPPMVKLNEFYIAAKPGQDYKITVEAADNKGLESVMITYALGDDAKSPQAMVYSPDDLMYAFTIPGEEITMETEDIKFTIEARDVTGLSTTSEEVTVQINKKPLFIEVSPGRNASTGSEKSPTISVLLSNEGENPQVTMTLKKGEVILLENEPLLKSTETSLYAYDTENLEDGLYTVSVTVVREDDVAAVETWNFTVGEPDFKPYFGQLHAHTAEYSDGSGTLADALNYFKGLDPKENVQFISVTDHSNYFDESNAANAAEALNDQTKMTAASLAKWNAYVGAMDAFNADNLGSRIALPGFEMTWSGGPGHINTFNSDGLISRNNKTLNNKTGDSGMLAYYETLIQNPDPLANLSQFNHPGATFGTFSDFAYLTASYDNKMVAVEVGNGEGAIGSGGYWPSYQEYTKALDKGWHVAPTNNQDNHKGKWGNSNTARTVIITDELSETGLLTGLKNMSVYSTEDENLNISYTLNGLIMGSIIEAVPESPLQFSVNVSDPDADDVISKMEIVSNSGRVVKSQSFDKNAVDWTFDLPSVQGYYYLRVTQADKHIAVTAPVWVGQAPRVGISSVTASTEMPVTNEGMKITTKIFNNESEPVTLSKIEYKLGEMVLKSEDLSQSVPSTGVYDYEFDYMPTQARVEKISVTATISIEDQLKTFTQDIQINVRDAEKLVYIGIDASHYNEYVRGNYKYSMGNFANLAVDYDVRVVELETSEDLIAATTNEKYKMLIFTPPTRRDGSALKAGYKTYTDEEIAAVKAFSEAGNTVIVGGWSDYYETYAPFPAEDHMAAQQNKLLAALGSSLRVSDDQVQDPVNNGGQKQRLYLTEYNMSNPYLDGVLEEVQVYSNYGGATIHAVGEDQLPTGTLKTSVSPMVYAFETGESVDSDKDGTTGVSEIPVPKYDNKYMVAASETLEHGENEAIVIVAGSVFMSNFEIKVDLDTLLTPEYSNYTILENVVKSINPIEITTISEVHKASEDVKFTIEGIATSNASGFDKDTAFFDTIYVQDGTAGINVFPVAGDVRAGQMVQITGTTSSYNGERQLNVQKITIVDQAVNELPAPKAVSAQEVNLATYLGSLVKLTGLVEAIGLSNDVVESIWVRDNSGTTRVFIDGYITSNKIIDNLEVGAKITAIGLSSIDVEGSRIRVRDRADIVCTKVIESDPEDSDSEDDDADVSEPKPPANQIKVSGSVKPEMISNAITEALKVAGEKAPEVILELDGDSNELAIVGDSLEALVQNNVDLVVSKAGIEYKVPAKEIDSARLSALFGSEVKMEDMELTIQVEKVAKETKDIINAWAESKGLKLIGNPVEFKITVTSKSTGDKVDLTEFTGYVERIIEIGYVNGEDGFNGVYVDENGNMSPVPTTFFVEGGKLYARIKSMTNSTYAVVASNRAYKGVEGHWSTDMVQKMVNRMVVTDVDNFNADKKITRAEFTDYVVRALGLYRSNQFVEGKFNDVALETAYAESIAIASKWGIVNGYLDGSFKPDQTISRQEAMVMYANALKYLEIEAMHSNRLNQFTDKELVADWALDSVNTVLDREIFNGVSESRLSPIGTFTHAEALQALYNFMNRF